MMEEETLHGSGRDDLGQSRILIADDDPLVRNLVASILTRQKFANLRFAEGGQSALEQFGSFRPDLLLLDMQMPDMSGLDVCRKVRAQPEFADTPILVQTATVDRKKMGELFAAGASDFLSKPVNPSELVARVKVHLERWNSLRELRAFRVRISRELDAARRMQADLLPAAEDVQKMANAAGLRVAAYNRSSSELGGDLWGVLPIDASHFGIFLADFTGHGVKAALNTFRLHALIHEDRMLHRDPPRLLSMLNQRLVRLLPPGQFATFMYLLVDHAADEVRFASAGAPPAVLVQGNTGRAELCDASGLPLGIAADASYKLHGWRFPSASTLLLFSDGLSEFPRSDGGRIGDEGLAEALGACERGLGPDEIINRMCGAAGITEASALPDDTTIICIDRPGAGKAPARRRRSTVAGSFAHLEAFR